MELQVEQGFASLDSTLRAFIVARSQGHTQLINLLDNQFDTLKAHVTVESTQTRQEISNLSSHVGGLSIHIVESKGYERLLKSFEFPKMNERRNNIGDNHDTTFEWIFEMKEVSNSPTTFNDAYNDGETTMATQKDQDADGDVDMEEASQTTASSNEACSSSFVEWLRSEDQPLFWISGKPGSGKSILMRFLLDDERTRDHLEHTYPGATIISHFFWLAGQEMERNVKGLFCSLLYQLTSKHQENYVKIIQNPELKDIKGKRSPSDWSIPELQKALCQVLRTSPVPVCVFLDALDEMVDSEPKYDHFWLLARVDELSQIPNVKICVSSRPETILHRHLDGRPSFRIQDLTRKDIESYARDELQGCTTSAFQASQDFQELLNALIYRADGVFLWVALALKSLRRGLTFEDSPYELRRRLDALPDGLNALYRDLWLRHNGDRYQEEAAKYLNFILDYFHIAEDNDEFCGRPMIYALFLALKPDSADDPDKRDDPVIFDDRFNNECLCFGRKMEIRCAGLIEFNLNDSSIQFIHRSAKDFLEDTVEGKEILQHDRSERPERLFCLANAYLTIMAVDAKDLDDDPPQPDKIINKDITPAQRRKLADIHDSILEFCEYVLGNEALEPLLETNFEAQLVDRLSEIFQTSPWMQAALSTIGADVLGEMARSAPYSSFIRAAKTDEARFGSFSKPYQTYLVFSVLYTRDDSSYEWLEPPWRSLSRHRIADFLLYDGNIVPNARTACWGSATSVRPPKVCRTITMLAALLEYHVFVVSRANLQRDGNRETYLQSAIEICKNFIALGEDIENRVVLGFHERRHPFYSMTKIWNGHADWDLPSRLSFQVGLLLDVNVAFLLFLFCQDTKPLITDPDTKKDLQELWDIAAGSMDVEVLGILIKEKDQDLRIHRPDPSCGYADSIKCMVNEEGFWKIPVDMEALYKETERVDNMVAREEFEDSLIERGLLVRPKDVEKDTSRFRCVEYEGVLP
ncbi:hypothetical protein B0T21DRAFT_63794 [Apiosordaria backusii]|uniref:Nephrocystin 3-like N-terminal domain-containing protein n=1 Tax=Apiosordaria backusii TaxID=314023 RepID=A0AA40AIN7_9PEZI|nr:hypothetical protein B0T21DRAFT_63794 [Apiosordaria backusii]